MQDSLLPHLQAFLLGDENATAAVRSLEESPVDLSTLELMRMLMEYLRAKQTGEPAIILRLNSLVHTPEEFGAIARMIHGEPLSAYDDPPPILVALAGLRDRGFTFHPEDERQGRYQTSDVEIRFPGPDTD